MSGTGGGRATRTVLWSVLVFLPGTSEASSVRSFAAEAPVAVPEVHDLADARGSSGSSDEGVRIGDAVTDDAVVDTGDGETDAIASWRRAIANDDVAALARLLDDAVSPLALSGASSASTLVAARSANGKSALMVACKLGELELARALVAAGANPGETSATGGTPFMFAVLGDRLDVARWLAGLGVALDARGSNGWSAVTIAAAKGLDATLGWLLEKGAPADVADLYGFTPLMRAVDNAHEDAARRLLAAGARPDAADESGNTALHHAVAGGRATLVELLLGYGASPRAENRAGATPAALAAELRSLAPALAARLARDGRADER